MRSKFRWSFALVIIVAFSVGALWGVKIIRDRTSREERLEADSKLRILAPAGIFSRELLLEFQRREKIEVELATEIFPSALLRRALKSAPGQLDAVLVYHYQVSGLRNERKLANLYDSRGKFPTTISPDFRRLPNDRNLMETAPLLWGVVGLASKKEIDSLKRRLEFWPSLLIGLEDPNLAPTNFAVKMQPELANFKSARTEPPPDVPLVVSHAALAFSPLKERGLKFQPLHGIDRDKYVLWILTLAALPDGDTERTRKFIRFLLEPAGAVALVQGAHIGATTLREQPGLEVLPENLRASFFRTFPIDSILLERDDRVRAADDVLEQIAMGAVVKPVITKAAPVEPKLDARSLRASKRVKPEPAETSGDEVGDDGSAPSETAPVTPPSENSGAGDE